MKSNIGYHCKLGLGIRLLMIIYGLIQDNVANFKYTDIDYQVFTDAARHVLNGDSPYDRYTYRYSPILAYILIPNIICNPIFGKILFSLCDIILCKLIWELLKVNNVGEKKIIYYVYFWLYNPWVIIISTRGNGDSLSSLLVLGTLLAFKRKQYVLAGFLHGVSIHFRIYPIAFSLCMYLSIKEYKGIKVVDNSIVKKTLIKMIPTFNKMKLVLACLISLITINMIFYKLYGYTYLNESMFYHLSRKDIKHNFSAYFYLQYLSSVYSPRLFQKLLTVLPQFDLMVIVSIVYSTSDHIYFAHLLIALIMVTYNTVVTCQYFIWFISLIPLVLPHLKFTIKDCALTVILWGIAQVAWLSPAYLLEFKNQNTFFYIWLQGLIFFSVNIYVITKLIKWYSKDVKFKHD